MGGIAQSTLRIGGMHCAACADVVERALRSVPGVVEAHVNAASQLASVRWDEGRTRPTALADAVRAAGYDAAPDTAAQARAARTKEARTALWRLFVAGLCAVQVMMLAEPAYLAGAGDIAPEYLRLLHWGAWLLTLPVMLFSAAPFFAGAWRSTRTGRIGMDVPVALGIAVAFAASTAAAFDPRGPFGSEVYFDSIAMFVAFLLGGRFLEMKARHRAEQTLEGATSRLPQAVTRLAADGSAAVVPLAELRPGDRVRTALGEAFAADGVVVEGETEVDESLLTGESRPAPRTAGDAVVAGSLNIGRPVVMRVDRLGPDTRYEAIAALMRAARAARPATLATADRWAAPFLWAILVLAGAAGIAWSFIDPARVPWVVVSVLIVTCPCALSLAAPAALLAASGRLARDGLLLRDIDALARLAHVDTLFVDKTGTLTSGALACTRVVQRGEIDGLDPGGLAARASSLAAWSRHPVSLALAAAHDGDGSVWHSVREEPGRGIEAVDAQGSAWRLGAASWVAGGSARADDVALGCDGRLLAAFFFDEQLRDDAAAAVASLRKDGLELRLLSGDEPRRVESVAARLEIVDAAGGLSPEDKLAELRAAQAAGHVVAMIGDGVNDAPVLAQADVSLAMGDGAQVARAQADGVLVAGRLAVVANARKLARRTLRVIAQSLAWAAVYNLVCVPLAMFGALPPWAAGLGMAASSLVVVLNALRLAR